MNFGRVFARRSAICYFVICFLFLFCCLRLYSIATGPYAQVQNKQSSLRVSVARPRGTIYDRNMLPLNNQKYKIMAAVSPTPRAVVAISSALRGEERLENILKQLRSGKPVVCEVEEIIDCEGIVCTKVPVPHSKDQPAEHIIGYLNSSGHGEVGLEKAYDELLFSAETIDAIFKTDGMGRVMEGEEIIIEGEKTSIGNGLVTTIDINIQAVAEKEALDIEKGAVVVIDVKNGDILAMVSKPSFDCTRISDFLDSENSSLLNRALSAYNVGSVFKPCVAAAGIMKGRSEFVAECKGLYRIIDRDFKCHYYKGHDILDLSGALAQSCNVFFYKYALEIGRTAIYNMSSSLGFGASLSLANGINSAAGSVTPYEELENPAALANMSIGQGKVVLSPITILNLYSAIANDGSYFLPRIVKSTINKGRKTEVENISATRAFSKETAEFLKGALVRVITEGTGKTAAPKLCAAAGKTATAQTGVYDENGKEITNGWFCGFFPVEEPRFAVSVLSEDAIGGDVSHIFANIADGIIKLGI